MLSTTSKLTEMPPHFFFFTSFSAPSRTIKPPFTLLFLKPFSTSTATAAAGPAKNSSHKPHQSLSSAKPHASSWLDKWPSLPPPPPPPPPSLSLNPKAVNNYAPETSKATTSAIERIVLRLRNLGLGSDDEDEEQSENNAFHDNSNMSVTGEERLGDLLKREWVRPDTMLAEEDDEFEDSVLPWERQETEEAKFNVEVEEREVKKRTVKAPSLAELTIEDGVLRRLRRQGMTLRERINVPKAGVANAVLEKIHEKWRKNELVRLKFHEVLARDMKTAHEIVERRTGGLVIWRSGSVMMVYRGSNYEGPFSRPQPVNPESDALFIPDVMSPDSSTAQTNDGANTTHQRSNPVLSARVESMTEEEAEFSRLLDGLGPRFEEWWGTGILPVDADLLPQTIPGYKTPFRLLPVGMRSRLTNAEMTNLRKLAKSLPCHFALGRNRHHQGLAAAIIKLWEKSLVVKIAVKRGIQNTNNKLMAEEVKMLTGGVLLLRNKYYIVLYRGKDFVPPSVAGALTERQEMTKQIQDVEEKVRTRPIEAVTKSEDGQALAGTLAEFYEAQARWGREISSEEHEKMIDEASRAKTARIIKRIEHKLSLSQAKKLKAERLLAKIVSSWVPAGPSDDLETITDEERVMYRQVGLRMKAYLPLGIRGVFDGVIENMHLHWKHRELVKLISKEKELAFVEETARLLEYESGGILVTVERVPKGYALIFYRGKNYRRPISLRPRNLLTKAKALKRRVALQRYEALSQHISDLEKTIEQTKTEMGDTKDVEHRQLNHVSEFTQSDDDASWMDSGDEDEDFDDADDEDSEFSSFEVDDSRSNQKGKCDLNA